MPLTAFEANLVRHLISQRLPEIEANEAFGDTNHPFHDGAKDEWANLTLLDEKLCGLTTIV